MKLVARLLQQKICVVCCGIFCILLTFFILYNSNSETSYAKFFEEIKSIFNTKSGQLSSDNEETKSYVRNGKRYYIANNTDSYIKVGTASWYGDDFHGKTTSSSEKFDKHQLTTASPDLPLLSYVKVTNLNNGRQVVVKVNDRGPFVDNRILDLSYAAAKKLGFANKGLAKVKVEIVKSSHLTNVALAKNSHINIKDEHNKNNDKLNVLDKRSLFYKNFASNLASKVVLE